MIKEVVEVIEVIEEKVKIEFDKKKMCLCCRFSFLCGSNKESLLIDNCGFSLKKGDRIKIAINGKSAFLASSISFLVPVIIFVACLIVFQGKGEINSFFLALGAVCFYYIIVKVFLMKQGKKFNLKIIEKL